MDLREKSRKIGKWMEWVLRLRWPALALAFLPILFFVQAQNGHIINNYLGQIHLNFAFPFLSNNLDLAHEWLDLYAWLPASAALIWLLGMSLWQSPHILWIYLLCLLGQIGLSFFEFAPWLYIMGGLFFLVYAFSRISTPIALVLSGVFSFLLPMSMVFEICSILNLAGGTWLPFEILMVAIPQSIVLLLIGKRLAGWKLGQTRRETLVRSTEKLIPSFSRSTLVAFGGLLAANAIDAHRTEWMITLSLWLALCWIFGTILFPAWQSTLPLREKAKKA